jgi:carboxymethylenebutenolidase
MSESLSATTVRIAGHHGDGIEAYLARPEGGHRRGGVVVIHHMPGYDRATKEMVRRLAELGYDAICPNLHFREAPGAAPDDAAATVRAAGGVPDERLVGDIAGAADHLRSLPTSNGRVGVIGHCSGGRQAVLAACELDVEAAVDCYGAFVTGTPPEGFPLKVTNLVDRLPELRAPLLGLFGGLDAYPGPEQVAELDAILTAHGKEHAFHTYPDAGHAFFAVDRPSYNVAAANDGWERIADFLRTHLGV